MRKLIAIALLLAASGLGAQNATHTPEHEIAYFRPSMKASDATVPDAAQQIAQLKVEVAQLMAQIHELQLQVQLYEAATGTTQRRQNDQKAIQAAQADAEAAEKTKK